MPYDPALAKRLIALEAQAQGVPPDLALAVAQTESSMQPGARSRKGAIGLMQLMPDTAQELGVNPHSVPENIRGGVTYLKQQLDRFGDSALALAAYNAGPEAVQRAGGVPPYRETQQYIGKVETAQHRAAMQERLRALQQLDQAPGTPPAAPPAPPPGTAPAPPPLPPLGQHPVIDIAKGNPEALPEGSLDDPAMMARASAAARRAEVTPPSRTARSEVRFPIEDDPTKPWLRGAAATGISAGLTAGGVALGGLTAPVSGPAGPIVGGLAGSMGAREINKALGLEDPGMVGDTLAVVGPLVPYVPTMARGVARRLPGAAPVLHEEAAATLQQLPQRLTPAAPSAQLYAQAAQGNPPIPAIPILQQAQALIAQEQGLQASLRSRPLLRVAEDLSALAQHSGGAVPLNVLRDHQQRLGLLIRRAQADNWPQLQGLRRLYGSFHEAYEQAATQGIPQAGLLRQATAAARREFATEDLAELFQPGRGINTRADGLVQVNGGKLLDAFNRKVASDEVFAQSFAAQELNDIREMLQQIARLPRIPAPRGVAFGAGAPLGRAGLAGGITQYAFGDANLTALVSGIAAGAPLVLSHALMSQPGRAFLRHALQTQGMLTAGDVALLSTIVQSPSLLSGQPLAVAPGALPSGAGPATQ